MYTAARLANSSGLLSNSDWIPMTGRAIHKVLTHIDWTDAFLRCGLGGSLEQFRPKLRNLLSGMDLSPKKPSTEELRMLLSKESASAKGNDWDSLILAFSAHVHTLPPDARPPHAANVALPTIPWTAEPPPARVCNAVVAAEDIQAGPLAPVNHFAALVDLPAAVSENVPVEPGIRQSSPVRNTRLATKKRAEQESQEFTESGASSSHAVPSSSTDAPRQRRRLNIMGS